MRLLGRERTAKQWVREFRRAISWHRRLLAAGLLAGSVAMTISALSPAPPAMLDVTVAAHDIAGGRMLGPSDVRMLKVLPESVPEGAIRRPEQVLGRMLAAPVRRGETLTDVRLVGQSLLASYDGEVVAVPLRIADGATTALLAPGDVIDVLAASANEVESSVTGASEGQLARVVAASVPVLTLPREQNAGLGGNSQAGALLVVAATDETAARLAAAAATSQLSLTIKRPTR